MMASGSGLNMTVANLLQVYPNPYWIFSDGRLRFSGGLFLNPDLKMHFRNNYIRKAFVH